MFVWMYPLHLLFFLFGAVAFWRARELRKIAAWVMALPLVFLFLPGLLKTLFGGPVSDQRVIGFLAIAALALLVVMIVQPKRASGWMPAFVYRSGWFNGLIVFAQVLGWMVPVALIAFLASGESSGSGGSSPGMGVAVLFVGGAVYIVGTGALSLLATVHGWLGLRSGIEDASRKLHVTQLVLGIPPILLAFPVLGWLVEQQQ